MRIFIFFLLTFPGAAFAQQIIKGTIVESDSSTALPFVYIINKSNGSGTMSDNEGRFSLFTNANDTIICSYVGYLKLKKAVSDLKPGPDGKVKVAMIPLPVTLAPVTVTVFKLKPYERTYMNEIIEESRFDKINYVRSPITALYMQYSKEGRQIRKLAKIFEGLLIEEEVQKKLSREILVRLTGDEKIDYLAFRKYCYYVSDYYIINHDGFELYSRVMECYKRWKAERGAGDERRLREQQ